MPEPRTYRFAAELARLEHGVTVDNILGTHVADENGKCPACHLDDKLRQPWPCPVWHFADRAHRLLHQRLTG